MFEFIKCRLWDHSCVPRWSIWLQEHWANARYYFDCVGYCRRWWWYYFHCGLQSLLEHDIWRTDKTVVSSDSKIPCVRCQPAVASCYCDARHCTGGAHSFECTWQALAEKNGETFRFRLGPRLVRVFNWYKPVIVSEDEEEDWNAFIALNLFKLFK